MTSSNGNIYLVTGPLCGEFVGHRWITSQKPVKGALMFSVPNRLLNKKPRRWWFETPSHSVWRHCNDRWWYVRTIHWFPPKKPVMWRFEIHFVVRMYKPLEKQSSCWRFIWMANVHKRTTEVWRVHATRYDSIFKVLLYFWQSERSLHMISI